jgi:hypothetical protein
MKMQLSPRFCCALTLLPALLLLPVPAIGGDKTQLVVDDDKVQCPNAAFSRIQDAVDAATPGDHRRGQWRGSNARHDDAKRDEFV